MATSEDVIAQQVALYGEPLSSRFGRLMAAYRIPQSRLAAVIGLSAPMLSQVASGQRVKISNPAVFARLLRLEELANTPAVRSGDPALLAAALEEAAASRPVLTTERATLGQESVSRSVAVDYLASLASPDELRSVASATRSDALADVLREAAVHAPGPAA